MRKTVSDLWNDIFSDYDILNEINRAGWFKIKADDIRTYKFYCFNGTPEVAYVSSNGENGEKDLYLDYFDMEWNWLPIGA